VDIKDIKIEAQTIVANEGRFEPHPEGYTPRVFAAVWERGAKVYEILQNGHAIPWPCLPILEGFDYWVLYVEHLSDVDMHRAPKKAGFGPTQKAIDNAQVAHRQYQQDPVPQADGYSESFSTPKIPSEVWKALKEFHEDAERESGTPSWIGEIDGKRYSGLGKPESGPLSHLPEGSH
jgi:hypothetical protein